MADFDDVMPLDLMIVIAHYIPSCKRGNYLALYPALFKVFDKPFSAIEDRGTTMYIVPTIMMEDVTESFIAVYGEVDRLNIGDMVYAAEFNEIDTNSTLEDAVMFEKDVRYRNCHFCVFDSWENKKVIREPSHLNVIDSYSYPRELDVIYSHPIKNLIEYRVHENTQEEEEKLNILIEKLIEEDKNNDILLLGLIDEEKNNIDALVFRGIRESLINESLDKFDSVKYYNLPYSKYKSINISLQIKYDDFDIKWEVCPLGVIITGSEMISIKFEYAIIACNSRKYLLIGKDDQQDVKDSNSYYEVVNHKVGFYSQLNSYIRNHTSYRQDLCSMVLNPKVVDFMKNIALSEKCEPLFFRYSSVILFIKLL